MGMAAGALVKRISGDFCMARMSRTLLHSAPSSGGPSWVICEDKAQTFCRRARDTHIFSNESELFKRQCCGTVTIFYGFGSGFWQVTVLVPTFDKFRFQFRARPWPCTASKNCLEKILSFYIVSFLQGKKLISFNKFIVKCEWKILNEGNQTHNF